MRPILRKAFSVLLALSSGVMVSAFSLYGPFETWMTTDIGYNLPGADIGGPMALGNEYRWNTPTIVYGYDSAFLNFFGQQGVDAIDRGMAILNALPAASQMSADLHEFPVDTRHFNYRAQALGILDIKSYALSEVLSEMGVAPAERYIYTLRARFVDPIGIAHYSTIKRNFDPITFEPSSYVNGTLYTYRILQTYAQPDTWEAVESTVDPYAPSVTTVAALTGLGGGTTDFRGTSTLLSDGMFYTGLTRDDAGALKYLLSTKNFNLESLPTNSIPAGGGSPWFPVSGTATNTNAVVTAIRPGVDKIRFQKAEFDSVLGTFFTNVVSYTDTFLSNSIPRQQGIQRILTTPDIVFSAGDLGVLRFVPIFMTHTVNPFVNSSGTNAGPGTINGPIVISFSTLLPYFINTSETDETASSRGSVWGTFDGTTNAPIVFPSGTSILQIEERVLNSAKPNPWRLPP